MNIERILIVFNSDTSIRGIASYAENGVAQEMTEEAMAEYLAEGPLLAQIQALQATEKANEDRVRAAEEERDAKIAEAETIKSTVEADRDAKLAEKSTRIAELEAQIAELTAEEEHIAISDRQFFQQLAIDGEITEEEAEAAVATGTIPATLMALVEMLPTERQFGARMMLKGATVIESNHPLTNLIAQLYGWNDDKMKTFFAAAALL